MINTPKFVFLDMNYMAVTLLVFTILTSGCINASTGEPGVSPNDSEQNQSDQNFTDRIWCDPDDSWSSLNPATGETVEYNIEGKRMVNDTEVCVATWESENISDGEVGSIEMLFSENGDYRRITLFSDNKTVINEIETTN